MIHEVTMYTVKCDHCGKEFDSHSYCGWIDGRDALDVAKEDGWIEEGGKHYCPDCYEYDEEDNLIIKQAPQAQNEQK